MNLRDLQYLIAIAEYKHFGKAAKASFVSQPTLSAQIKKLEDYLGVQLIERTQRQVFITSIGQAIIDKAKIILQESNEIQILAKQARDPFSGIVKLGIIPTLSPYLLPLIIPLIKSHFPNIELHLYEDQTARIIEQLKTAHLDTLILALPIVEQGLVQVELFEEKFYLALPLNHRLFSKKIVQLTDLENENILLLSEGHCLRTQALEICNNLSIKQPYNFSATSLETLRQMVASGVGLTLLPELATQYPNSKQNNVVVKPFAKPSPSRQIGMLWRNSSSQHPVLKAIADTIKKHMQNKPHH